MCLKNLEWYAPKISANYLWNFCLFCGFFHFFAVINKSNKFLADSMHVRLVDCFLWQKVGIPVGTNCASLLADLLLYSYEDEVLNGLIKDGKRKLARRLNLWYRYTNELITLITKKRFKQSISDIYSKELTIKEKTESTSVASYLDLLFIWDENSNIASKYTVNLMCFASTLCALCLAKLHLRLLMVSLCLNSFAMHVVARIMLTFCHTVRSCRDDFCRMVTKLILCPTRLNNSVTDTLI